MLGAFKQETSMETSLEQALAGLKEEVERRSEIVEPWHSYWYYRPLKNFPPKTIQQPNEYDGSDRVSLACTQTRISATFQRKLVKEWCELLPTLSKVRVLWLQSKVNQDLFEAVCGMTNLKGLYIKWSSINSLRPIARLKNLTHLHIGGAPSAKPIEILSELKNLIDLEVSKVWATSDLSFLENMPWLKSLSISGDNNSLKSLKIKSFKPISALKSLERLQLTTATVLDESLEPISHLPSLKYLLISNQYKMEELAKLSGRLTHVDCGLFRPIGESYNWIICERCRKKRMVSLTGKSKPWLCLDCDSKQIEKHIMSFEKIADEASNSESW